MRPLATGALPVMALCLLCPLVVAARIGSVENATNPVEAAINALEAYVGRAVDQGAFRTISQSSTSDGSTVFNVYTDDEKKVFTIPGFDSPAGPSNSGKPPPSTKLERFAPRAPTMNPQTKPTHFSQDPAPSPYPPDQVASDWLQPSAHRKPKYTTSSATSDEDTDTATPTPTPSTSHHHHHHHHHHSDDAESTPTWSTSVFSYTTEPAFPIITRRSDKPPATRRTHYTHHTMSNDHTTSSSESHVIVKSTDREPITVLGETTGGRYSTTVDPSQLTLTFEIPRETTPTHYDHTRTVTVRYPQGTTTRPGDSETTKTETIIETTLSADTTSSDLFETTTVTVVEPESTEIFLPHTTRSHPTRSHPTLTRSHPTFTRSHPTFTDWHHITSHNTRYTDPAETSTTITDRPEITLITDHPEITLITGTRTRTNLFDIPAHTTRRFPRPFPPGPIGPIITNRAAPMLPETRRITTIESIPGPATTGHVTITEKSIGPPITIVTKRDEGRPTKTKEEMAETRPTDGMLARLKCIFGCDDGPFPRTRTTEDVPAITDPSVSVEAKRFMQERKECIFGCNDGPSPRTRTTEEVPAISDPSVSVEAKRALEYEHTETRYAGLEPTSIDDMSPPLPCISPGCDDAFWPRTRTTEDVPAMTDPSVSVEAARFMQEEVPAPTTTGSGIRVLPPCGPHGCFTDRVTFLTGTRRPVETGGVEVEAAAAAVMEEGPTRTREEEVVGPTTTDSGIHAVCDTLWCATHIPDRVTFLTRTRRPVETGGVDVEAVKVLEG